MVELISRPYAGFFEVKHFNEFVTNRDRPWFVDGALVLGGGCLWKPWKCDAPLPESFVEKLYEILY